MATKNTLYRCSECQAEESKWFGICNQCKNYNTFIEVTPSSFKPDRSSQIKNKRAFTAVSSDITLLDDVDINEVSRMGTGIDDFDRVLGGGLVQGSVVLLGGDPGIGKSTLLIQAVGNLSQKKNYEDTKINKVIYISGEESKSQVKMRSFRLGISGSNIFIYSEVVLENILETLEKEKPDFLIIDSIQTLYSETSSSSPGSVSQIKECASQITRIAKESNITIIIIAHVTKDGELAGPKALEHIVDTVIFFEGEKENDHRLLRALKNRYGNIDEVGILLMTETGLETVNDPTGVFTSSRNQLPGSSFFVSQEGTRSILMEIQSLIDSSSSFNPTRAAIGISKERLQIYCAIIHKFIKFSNDSIYTKNVFLTVIGGMRLSETGIDIPAVLSMLSSTASVALPDKSFSFGEIGLTGELRSVRSSESRIKEAARAGLKIGFIPKAKDDRLQKLAQSLDIQLYEFNTILDLVSHVFLANQTPQNDVKSKRKPRSNTNSQPSD